MYIKIDVETDASEESVRKIGEDSFIVRVREKALQNRANRRVLELIRREFGERGMLVKIINGHHSPNKILSLEIKGESD